MGTPTHAPDPAGQEAAATTQPPRSSPGWRRVAATTMLLSVAALVAVALAIVGFQGLRSDRRLDEQRVEDLRRVAAEVEDFFGRRAMLPASMVQLVRARDAAAGPLPADPETGRPYEYQPEGARAFTLCATFDDRRREQPGDLWWHDRGRYCFSLEVRER